MPFSVVEGAEISGIEQGDAIGETKRDKLVRGMMQSIARHSFYFLADPVLRPVEPLAPTRPGFRASPLLAQLRLRFGSPLLDRAEAPPNDGQCLLPIGDHPQMNDADVQASGLVGGNGDGIRNLAGDSEVDLTIAQLSLYQSSTAWSRIESYDQGTHEPRP